MRLFQSKEKKQETESAHSGYAEFARLAASSEPDQARTLAASFKQSEHVSSLSEKERRQRGSVAFRAYADKVLDDDRLTAEEEDAFGLVADALGVTNSEFQTTFRDVRNRLIVARMNDGRMDVIEPTTRPSAATGSQPHFMTKKDELVYLETPAKLMKEVAVREWQGRSSGVSLRVMNGVSFRTGGIRGRSVVVGTELQVADEGLLAVTSRRVVYMGNKTMELPHSKLMNIDVFSDGIRVHASNRQNAALFKLDDGIGQVVAATANAAVQNLTT